MQPTDLKEARKLAEAAKRNKLVKIVPSAEPPSVILILELADAAQSKAVAAFLRKVTPAFVIEMLDIIAADSPKGGNLNE